MVKGTKYKGVMIWDEQGNKRKEVPSRDGLHVQKQAEQAEDLDRIRDFIHGRNVQQVETDPVLLPSMSSTQSPCVIIEMDQSRPEITVSETASTFQVQLNLPLEVHLHKCCLISHLNILFM